MDGVGMADAFQPLLLLSTGELSCFTQDMKLSQWFINLSALHFFGGVLLYFPLLNAFVREGA